MADVKAAAERLRIGKYGFPVFNPLHMLSQQLMEDLCTVRDWALPLRDETALTESNLPDLGFTKALNGPTRWYSDWLTLKHGGHADGGWAAWGALYDCDRHPCLVVVFTIGDIRRLALALNIPLNP
jgi:hypothetical protein